MATEAALAARNDRSQKRTIAAYEEAVQDTALLDRLKSAQLPHRDMAWQDSERQEVMAEIAEHLRDLLQPVAVASDEDKRRVADFAAVLSGESQEPAPEADDEEEETVSVEQTDDQPPVLAAVLDADLVEILHGNGYVDIESLRGASDEDLLALRGIGPSKLATIREAVGQ